MLKTTPEDIAGTFRGCVQSGLQAGMAGNAVNVANLIAALFTATGQDIACVHESSVAIFSPDVTPARSLQLYIMAHTQRQYEFLE